MFDKKFSFTKCTGLYRSPKSSDMFKYITQWTIILAINEKYQIFNKQKQKKTL